MTFMPIFLKNDILLVSYPFSDLSRSKIRPAIAFHNDHPSQDCFIIPITSQFGNLLLGEFLLQNWKESGLNVESAVKRGIFTIHQDLVIKKIGHLSAQDSEQLEKSLRTWLGLF